MARAATTSDVFNAIADAHRREILDPLIDREKPVGRILDDLSMPQPEASSTSGSSAKWDSSGAGLQQ